MTSYFLEEQHEIKYLKLENFLFHWCYYTERLFGSVLWWLLESILMCQSTWFGLNSLLNDFVRFKHVSLVSSVPWFIIVK